MIDDERQAQETGSHGGLWFDRFHLAGPHGPLRADGMVLDLPRKPLALLWALASRAGDVVTKDELLASVWPQVVVNEGAISASLRDVRRALGDDARHPRLIATAHRIGYRFIAPVRRDRQAGAARVAAPEPVPGPAPSPARHAVDDAPFVGREAELAHLHEAHARAQAGRRQLVFVTGEAGLGKSRLVDAFVSSLGRGPRVGHGQCIEHYGVGEPYLPVLEALTRLCLQPGGQALRPLLRRHAPTWLAQLPALDEDDAPRSDPPPHAEAPASATHAGSVQRMLRELVEALDAIAARQPLVLVLEDMHWSDPPTVEALVMWARRREPARALVIATCRPVELIVNSHPLERVKPDLVWRHLANEIALPPLGAAHVHAYVERRLPAASARPAVADAVHRRSQGHPLFMVHMTDDLRRAGGVPAHDDASLAASVSDLIQAQLARLPPEVLAVLEAASAAGAEFATAAVAAALDRPVPAVEAAFETLARSGQFVEPRGLAEWPDGTLSGRYGFRHALHRDALRRRLGAARAAGLHGRIGERLAAAWGTRCVDVAVELAAHFEAAREPRRAALHRCQAAGMALRRHAYRESLAHADHGLALLAPRADGSDDRAELELQLARGVALLATLGYGTPAVAATYARALDLAVRLEDDAAIGPILAGLYNLYLTRAAFARVDDIADRLQALVDQRPEPAATLLLHHVRSARALFAGAPAASLVHAARALQLHDPSSHQDLAALYGEDLALASHHCAALAGWIAGSPEAAAHHLAAGFERARSPGQPFGQAQMLWMEALLRLDDGDAAAVDGLTRRLIELCAEHDIPLWGNGGRILRGGALAELGWIDEGRSLVDQGLKSWREAGTLLIQPFWLSVSARVERAGGRGDAALARLDEALATAHRTGERWYEVELRRQRSALLLSRSGARDSDEPRTQSQASLQDAVDLAVRQGARLFEARARMDLASCWLDDGRVEEASAMIERARDALSDAAGSRELQRAALLLERASTRLAMGSHGPAPPSGQVAHPT